MGWSVPSMFPAHGQLLSASPWRAASVPIWLRDFWEKFKSFLVRAWCPPRGQNAWLQTLVSKGEFYDQCAEALEVGGGGVRVA